MPMAVHSRRGFTRWQWVLFRYVFYALGGHFGYVFSHGRLRSAVFFRNRTARTCAFVAPHSSSPRAAQRQCRVVRSVATPHRASICSCARLRFGELPFLPKDSHFTATRGPIPTYGEDSHLLFAGDPTGSSACPLQPGRGGPASCAATGGGHRSRLRACEAMRCGRRRPCACVASASRGPADTAWASSSCPRRCLRCRRNAWKLRAVSGGMFGSFEQPRDQEVSLSIEHPLRTPPPDKPWARPTR